ncbi:type I-F CRISPR-associated protein Csy1 [Luteimonas sp. R10]|uniref:type I-F CRISPR-associated protein Csy1 n=1 Tax=Luteimonas sp. R10 TaxID=3108176 RepID=UPI003084ECDC|nr:type I-F CRISPR-associated protein Csy1 [Luteimonas sp. R10]
MSEEPERGSRSERFRSAIAAFIDARREAKLKGKEDDADGASKYEYGTWLSDAARRVGQIQAVTHVLKATHPDARGSSLHVAPAKLPQHAEVGTHLLGDDFAEDVVGNAAALDVFKLLKIQVDGHRLLDWMQSGDDDLRSALHPDPTVASGWMEAFGSLVRSELVPASHEAAKQVYWLIGSRPSNDADYHLLQPLFSSSLAHAVHADIQDARFGEANKLARQAFRAKEAHEAPYRDYRNPVARQLGGTKPQNISQLNSERGGINYLLASLPPPRWKPFKLRQLMRSNDVWIQFGYFGDVRKLIKNLSKLLLSNPDRTMETRITREGIEQALGAHLPAFAEMVQNTLEPSWTSDSERELDLNEMLWLDPHRMRDDAVFEAAYHLNDWPDKVAGIFANWVNAQLREAGLTTVGDDEYKHWARQAIVDAAWPVPIQRRAPAGVKA